MIQKTTNKVKRGITECNDILNNKSQSWHMQQAFWKYCWGNTSPLPAPANFKKGITATKTGITITGLKVELDLYYVDTNTSIGK